MTRTTVSASVRARVVKNWPRPIASSFGPVIGRVVDVPRFSKRAEQELRAAGWFPERNVDIELWRGRLEADGLVRMHSAAERFLAEFAGLAVDVGGPGISSVREPFELNPLRLIGELDRFAEWGEELGISLFPIGLLDRGRFLLGISETSEIFLVETWVATFGVGDAGLEHLVLGVMPKIVAE
jgi:hypothetical protein